MHMLPQICGSSFFPTFREIAIWRARLTGNQGKIVGQSFFTDLCTYLPAQFVRKWIALMRMCRYDLMVHLDETMTPGIPHCFGHLRPYFPHGLLCDVPETQGSKIAGAYLARGIYEQMLGPRTAAEYFRALDPVKGAHFWQAALAVHFHMKRAQPLDMIRCQESLFRVLRQVAARHRFDEPELLRSMLPRDQVQRCMEILIHEIAAGNGPDHGIETGLFPKHKGIDCPGIDVLRPSQRVASFRFRMVKADTECPQSRVLQAPCCFSGHPCPGSENNC